MERRRVLALLAGCAAASIPGCNGNSSGNRTTESPNPTSTQTAIPEDAYSLTDLEIENEASEAVEVSLDFTPTEAEEPVLRITVHLESTEQITWDDLSKMDAKGTFTVRAEFESGTVHRGTYDWLGDAGDDYRGLAVVVEQDSVGFSGYVS